jgi:hypothetical protein
MDLEIVTCGCINVSRQPLLVRLGASQTKRAGKKDHVKYIYKIKRTLSLFQIEMQHV